MNLYDPRELKKLWRDASSMQSRCEPVCLHDKLRVNQHAVKQATVLCERLCQRQILEQLLASRVFLWMMNSAVRAYSMDAMHGRRLLRSPQQLLPATMLN